MTGQGFTLASPAFDSDTHLPDTHTCEGEGVSPELVWTHPPAGVQSYALMMEDIDAPGGSATHWLVYDIPGDRDGVGRNLHALGRAGRNDQHHMGYGAPCPPPNQGDHRYRFRLYALDVATLSLDEGATRRTLERAMQGHELAHTDLNVRCRRTTS